MNTNTERKKKYIQIASRILEQEGPEGINIRRIAKEAGCTSAVLYKHFDNLNHLLVLASVKFLEPYISDFIVISKRSDITSMEKVHNGGLQQQNVLLTNVLWRKPGDIGGLPL